MSEFSRVVSGNPDKVEAVKEGRFGALKATYGRHLVLLKPAQFSNERFRGVPRDTFHVREVAAYRVDSRLLKFGLVPETVLTTYEGRPASAQKWLHGALLPGEMVKHLFSRDNPDREKLIASFFAKLDKDALVKLAVFDLVINAGDRHGRNLMVGQGTYKLWAIDNSVSFNKAYAFYRSVVHRYAFMHKLVVPDDVRSVLARVKLKDVRDAIGDLLSEQEVEHTYWRVRFILDHALDLSYMALSQGRLGRSDFPAYRGWFRRRIYPEPPPLVIKASW